MKAHTKIVLLVAFALFFTLTACTRQASIPPVSLPTSTGEAPFPYTTPGAGGVTAFGTQTAIAQAGEGTATTPEVLLATETPGAESQAGGGQAVGNETSTAETGGGQPGGEQAGGGGPSTAGGQPQASAPLINTPVVERPQTYTLQHGEWPICIARRFNLDIGTFFAQNGLNMNSKPAAGTVLNIPQSGSWNPSYGSQSYNPHPTTYTVQSGDTVNSIACHFGDVTPEAILAVNNLSSPSDIKPGMTLQIP